MAYGPIFIGGLDRSGKTLLRLALSLHPHIQISKRTDLWVRFYNRYGDLKQKDNFDRCLEDILTYKHIRALKPDGDRIQREFWQGEPTYARLFALFHEHNLQQGNKQRWGDQSELIERYADPILSAYPDARIIQMIRDPRDRYSASKQKWAAGKGKAGGATARWLYSMHLAQRNLKLYPGRYAVLQYENLVSQPDETLETICTFLGEEFSPTMLQIGHNPGAGADIFSPAYPAMNHFMKDFIGEFRANLNSKETAFIQKFSAHKMQQYGYSLKQIRFSPAERISFYTRFVPRNMLLMLAWNLENSLQSNSPIHHAEKSKPTTLKNYTVTSDQGRER